MLRLIRRTVTLARMLTTIRYLLLSETARAKEKTLHMSIGVSQP